MIDSEKRSKVSCDCNWCDCNSYCYFDIGETLHGVSLSIEEGSLSRERATFVLYNESDYQIGYCWNSDIMRLQVWRGEEWRYINALFQTASGCALHNLVSSESATIGFN